MHHELKRPGVTLELLHMEYLGQHADGLQYTAFCERYRAWKRRHRLTMRQGHKAGEKMFVDFSGKRPSITDRVTGAQVVVEPRGVARARGARALGGGRHPPRGQRGRPVHRRTATFAPCGGDRVAHPPATDLRRGRPARSRGA